MPSFVRIKAQNEIGKKIQEHFGLKAAPKIYFCEHHLCHAASAFYVSGFEEAAILTVDGRGEATSTMMSVGKKNKTRRIYEKGYALYLYFSYADWGFCFQVIFTKSESRGRHRYWSSRDIVFFR